MLKHISTVAAESVQIKQPEVCGYCGAKRGGIDGHLYFFQCLTTVFLWPNRKPLIKRSRKCIERAMGAK